MRKLSALITAAAAATLLAGAVQAAQPTASKPQVTVTVGGDLLKEIDKLGERDVQQQVDDLADVIQRELARDAGGENRWAGAQVSLVLTDLKPNRPTMQQAIDRPGLSIFDSKSIGGAAIEGEIVTADGERLPVRYERYSTSLADVFGYSTWTDADRAFDGLAANLRRGRLVSR